MPTPRQLLGTRGEDATAAWYLEQGYELLARNWRCPAGEADIVARRGAVLVVCEVKTRRGSRFGSGAEAVTRLKVARLRRTAASFLASECDRWRPSTVRFDVAEVVGKTVSVTEAAF